MSYIAIIGLILIVILVGVLLLKIRLTIDSVQGRVMLRLRPFVRASVLIADDIHYRLEAPFYRKDGELLTELLKQKADKDDPKKRKEEKAKKTGENVDSISSLRNRVRLLWVMLKSFRVNRLHLELNTRNALWNAWLFPVLHAYRMKGYETEIRFTGPSVLILDIENSVYRVTTSLLHYYLHKNRTS